MSTDPLIEKIKILENRISLLEKSSAPISTQSSSNTLKGNELLESIFQKLDSHQISYVQTLIEKSDQTDKLLIQRAQDKYRINILVSALNKAQGITPIPKISSLNKQEKLNHQKQKQKNGGKKAKNNGTNKQDPLIQAKLPPMNRLKLVVGKILSAEPVEESEKLYKEYIDVGENQPRFILTGVRKYIPIDQFIGQKVVVAANLKPKKMAKKYISQGMVMCGSKLDADGNLTDVSLVKPHLDSPIGTRVTVEGYTDGEPDTELKPKKKIFEKIIPDLQTSIDGIATYKGLPLSTPQGPCTCIQIGGPIS